MDIRAATRDWCDIIWLVDPEDQTVAATRALLARSGTVVEALRAPAAEAAAAVRDHAPDAIATFYDTGMEHIAEIAHELGLPFHSPEVARRLEDKLHQRQALTAAGLPSPAVVELPATLDRAAVEQRAAALRFPAVLKPRKASGSWHTFPVADPAELGARWEELAGEPEDRIVEEYLSDGPPMPLGFEADYVSVETLAVAGELTHLAITGRFPLAPPFRETGYFIPSTLRPQQQAQVLDLAERTLRALGVREGCTHTEIKLTADGPAVIEVNGRAGGGIPDMLALAGGVELVSLILRGALGSPPGLAGPVPTAGVAYRFFGQPPLGARRLRAIDGLDQVRLLPGVERVDVHWEPGTMLDSSHGTRTYLYAVVGRAEDHGGVAAIDDFLRTHVTVEYDA